MTDLGQNLFCAVAPPQFGIHLSSISRCYGVPCFPNSTITQRKLCPEAVTPQQSVEFPTKTPHRSKSVNFSWSHPRQRKSLLPIKDPPPRCPLSQPGVESCRCLHNRCRKEEKSWKFLSSSSCFRTKYPFRVTDPFTPAVRGQVSSSCGSSDES